MFKKMFRTFTQKDKKMGKLKTERKPTVPKNQEELILYTYQEWMDNYPIRQFNLENNILVINICDPKNSKEYLDFKMENCKMRGFYSPTKYRQTKQ